MSSETGESAKKKARRDIFSITEAVATTQRSQEEVVAAYKDAIRTHPFYDNCHSCADLYSDGVFCDGEGNPVAVLIRGGLPSEIAQRAADVLRPAAVKTSLRTTIYGGESPNSGIAGYFDYRGSPIEFKHRKTAFTYEHADEWHNVFPMVDYVSELYRHVMPNQWAKQNAAIPDLVRIHNSPFSTLTINSRFRTASHTDAGDFDDGYGCLSVLEGDFKGLALTLDHFKVNFCMYAGDVLIFNTHHFHSNTELEAMNHMDPWSRLTCVFYYRASLGEANAYSEYTRRLQAAVHAGQQLPARLRNLSPKNNGVNLNRPAPVYPVVITPFSPIAALAAFYNCRPHAQTMHTWLLSAALADVRHESLFGEPLEVADGVPLRDEEALEIPLMSTWALRSPAHGGFVEHDDVIAAAAEKEKYFEPDYLEAFVGNELHTMWKTARDQWLGLVKADWETQKNRNPARTDFLWNNRSRMNASFFELCDVAKGLLSALVDRETPSQQEESAFWLLFAAHLNKLCATELRMPVEAMSMRKLNVKLKDYNFGGTRYFKDMPEDEKRRRLERKRRIEEARLRGRHSAQKASDWLLNDSFDYQSEDCVVDYASHGWELPAAHAARRVQTVIPLLTAPEASQTVVRVLVVLPKRCSAELLKTKSTDIQKLKLKSATETDRLLANPAAVRMLHEGPVNTSLQSSRIEEGVQVEYTYAYSEAADCAPPYDFVILQHVLASIPDPQQAAAYIARARRLARGGVLIVESDQQCRQYFCLKADVRTEYDSVAQGCFQHLLAKRYGVAEAAVRTKQELLTLLEPYGCHARFKLRGSPLNTMVLYVTASPAQ